MIVPPPLFTPLKLPENDKYNLIIEQNPDKIDIITKEFINKLLARYVLYRTELSYTSAPGDISFQLTIFINKNTATISIENHEVTYMDSTFSIARFFDDPAFMDSVILDIDADLHTLLYINS